MANIIMPSYDYQAELPLQVARTFSPYYPIHDEFMKIKEWNQSPLDNEDNNNLNAYQQPLYYNQDSRTLVEQGWAEKQVREWNKDDILNWVFHVSQTVLNVSCSFLPGEKLYKLSGNDLVSMSEQSFISLDQTHGSTLYKELQKLLASQINESEGRIYTELTASKKSSTPLSEVVMESMNRGSSYSDTNFIKPASPVYKKRTARKEVAITEEENKPVKQRGRPRGLKRKKKPEKKLGRLWEFIRDLLKDPKHCPKEIAWENHDEGTFRFVQSDAVAKLWGQKKENPDMNYEKLSRAMRYYYKSKVLLPVIGRRLVYKFGPAAEDWRVDNPNFKD